MDREITLAAPATRVVALTAADCEILYALGAGDTLVGRGAYCDYPAEVLLVPSVEIRLRNQPRADHRAGAAAGADGHHGAERRSRWRCLQTRASQIAVSSAADIEGVYEAIAVIGALTGKDAEAAALIADMKAQFAELAQEKRLRQHLLRGLSRCNTGCGPPEAAPSCRRSRNCWA